MVDVITENDLPRDEAVVLTFFHLTDAPVMCEMDSDPEHRRRFDFPEGFVPTVEHSERVITGWTNARQEGQFVFALRDLGSSDLLGGCEIRLLGNHVANLSYWTVPRHRSQGIASRGVALACKVARARLAVQLLEIVVDPDNIASRRVAIRNGFREVGIRDGWILHVKDMDGLQRF